MFEKVNANHPDKCADRIAGAIVDLAYSLEENPRIAVEVLLGHGNCKIMIETSLSKEQMEGCLSEIYAIVDRINGKETTTEILYTAQDIHLAENQSGGFKCGDNGIFKGAPLTEEQKELTEIAQNIYAKYPYDGKYILDEDRLIICQSNVGTDKLYKLYPNAVINPLGDWTGGSDVDTGATNRKLGSDMADGVTGGGLHGKDLSKADVALNIYAFLKAQETGKVVELSCAIGDAEIDGNPYSEIVEIAREYINGLGGFEKFAEWGLVR